MCKRMVLAIIIIIPQSIDMKIVKIMIELAWWLVHVPLF